MKLNSAPGFPAVHTANGVNTNLVINQTSTGEWQVARVLSVAGNAQDAEYELLWEGESAAECREFLAQQVERDFPGLQQQVG